MAEQGVGRHPTGAPDGKPRELPFLTADLRDLSDVVHCHGQARDEMAGKR